MLFEQINDDSSKRFVEDGPTVNDARRAGFCRHPISFQPSSATDRFSQNIKLNPPHNNLFCGPTNTANERVRADGYGHWNFATNGATLDMQRKTSWAPVTGKNLGKAPFEPENPRLTTPTQESRTGWSDLVVSVSAKAQNSTMPVLNRTRGLLAAMLSLAALAGLAGLAAGCTSEPNADDKPLAAPVVTPAPRPSLLKAMKERGVVRVGVKFDVPLFGLKNPATGKLSGFDIEIAKGIVSRLYPEAEDITKHIEFVEAISKNREKFLADRTVDLIISTYTINSARKELVDFAGPYYIAGQDILARKTDVDNGVITGIGDVNGKKVCSVTGSTSLNNLRDAAPGVDVSITKDKYSECFVALTSGLVQAMSTDDVILLGLAQGFPEYAVTGNPFHTEPYGIGITKGDEELRSFVNDALEKMFADGTWDRAFRETIGTTGTPAPAPPSLDRYLRPAG
jgi:glutamate transport system substrate-binding protein